MTNSTQNSGMTTKEVAARFHALAQQEKWFDIQDELFSDDVKSIEPSSSPYLAYLGNVEGKAPVRRKGEDFVSKIEAVHNMYTSDPVMGDNHFAVERRMDITVRGLGRIQINELMLYEVRNGQIVLEQFFY